jgi:hypothetical protein
MKTLMAYILVLSAALAFSTALHADEVTVRVGSKFTVQRLQELSEAGDAAAQRMLAERLYTGDLVKKDPATAYKWALVSVASRDKNAKHLLKEMELFVSAEDQKKGKTLSEQYLSEQKKKAANEDSSDQIKK